MPSPCNLPDGTNDRRMRCFMALILVLWMGVVGWAAESTRQAPVIAVAQGPAILSVWNRDLVTFRRSIGWNSPAQRAAQAIRRFADLPEDALGEPITLVEANHDGERGLAVQVGGRFLFGLAREDADAEAGQTLEALGAEVVHRVNDVFAARRDQGNLRVLVAALALSLTATLGLVVALLALAAVVRRLQARIDHQTFHRLPPAFGLDLKPLAVGAVRRAIHLPVLAFGIVAGFIWLTFVLDRFPYTRPWATTLGEGCTALLVSAVQGTVAALPGLAVVVAILIATRLAIRTLGLGLEQIEERRISVVWMLPETARATRRIASVLIWLFALTVAYPYLPGSSSDAFKGISVFAGLMLTFGSTGLVNQVMSGLVVVYSRSMGLGDLVKIGEVEGRVTDLGFLATRVRTVRDEEISIPNAVLVGGNLINYSRFNPEQGMLLATTVTIGYDAPWRQVHALLELAARRTPGLRQDPAPEVVQKALDDFYVRYEVRVRMVAPDNRSAVLSALLGQIQDVFNEHGVRILSPHFQDQPAKPMLAPPAMLAGAVP